MAIVYEHWRTDTNTCFYVGMSKFDDCRRAFNTRSRNRYYNFVVKKLRKSGLSVRVEIIWVNLLRDCAGTYEKIRIAYQRALVGNGLTNLAVGGRGGALYGPQNGFYGKKHSESTKEAIAEANRIRNWTTEMRRKKKERSSGSNNPMYGKTSAMKGRVNFGTSWYCSNVRYQKYWGA